MRARGLIFCALLLVLAAPALAERAIDRVPAGVDYWQTLSSGATAYDFASNPLPAGFLCAGSAPFTGRIQFEGVPLRTEPAGILGTTDTIIERLDDAVFNSRGDARTRIRARALNLIATEPLKTPCGLFRVTARLADKQPVTQMAFHREDKDGGTFQAQLRLRVRIEFTNLQTGEASSVVHTVNLPTVDKVPFAIGAAAIQCVQVASTTTTTRTSPIRLDDGRPLFEHPRMAQVTGKATTGSTSTSPTPTTDPSTPTSTSVVTGCYCKDGVCKNTYSWHDPCAGETYEKCEQHWTYNPCQLGYTSQCASDTTQQSYAEQLQLLYDKGYINEKPEVVLQKQLRTAEQIWRDQAARERKALQKLTAEKQ
jgi:hypothetical protein